MTIEEALEIVESATDQGHLNRVQEIVFRQSWEGKSYLEMAKSSDYEVGYIRDTGSKLWQVLSRTFGKKVTKKNIHRILKQAYVATRTTQTYCTCVEEWPQAYQIVSEAANTKTKTAQRQDWADAVDVSVFYNRTRELATLCRWIVQDRCRLVTISGIGGIGKTSLAAKLAQQIQDDFQYLIWRSLRNTPPLKDLAAELIQFLSGGQPINLSETESGRILQLLEHLRFSRCLLILDNAESILQPGNQAGYYQTGYEGYGQLIRCVAEASHSSCLVLTSREKPRSLAAKEGEKLSVRSLRLTGLDATAIQEIFQAKGEFQASEPEWRALTKYYAGNPLALKMLAPVIQDFFDCSVSKFILFLKQSTFIFDDIRHLLDQQFNRLSDLEKELMCQLALKQEPGSISKLLSDFAPTFCQSQVLTALASLQRRSLIEKNTDDFILMPIIKQYIKTAIMEDSQTKSEVESQKSEVQSVGAVCLTTESQTNLFKRLN